MAELQAGDNPIKGVAASGVAVATVEDPGSPTPQIQKVAPVDRHGRLLGTVATAVDPVKVQVPIAAGAPTLVLAADETRSGAILYWIAGNVLIGFGNYSGNLTNFRANALPWIATTPFVTDWKGPIYAACPSGGADTDVYVQAK